MRVKLLNTDLIRTFGGAIVEMNETQATKYITKGLAKPMGEMPPLKQGVKNVPPEDKKIWTAPEKKLFDEKESMKPFPGVDDKLFDI